MIQAAGAAARADPNPAASAPPAMPDAIVGIPAPPLISKSAVEPRPAVPRSSGAKAPAVLVAPPSPPSPPEPPSRDFNPVRPDSVLANWFWKYGVVVDELPVVGCPMFCRYIERS